jgi:uracil-DNA glycosylase
MFQDSSPRKLGKIISIMVSVSSLTLCTRDLSLIAKQGVLWLNTSLTVRAHKAGSHSKKGWETFTAQVVRTVLNRKDNDFSGVVLMAWGLPAQKTFATIGINASKHFLLK